MFINDDDDDDGDDGGNYINLLKTITVRYSISGIPTSVRMVHLCIRIDSDPNNIICNQNQYSTTSLSSSSSTTTTSSSPPSSSSSSSSYGTMISMTITVIPRYNGFNKNKTITLQTLLCNTNTGTLYENTKHDYHVSINNNDDVYYQLLTPIVVYNRITIPIVFIYKLSIYTMVNRNNVNLLASFLHYYYYGGVDHFYVVVADGIDNIIDNYNLYKYEKSITFYYNNIVFDNDDDHNGGNGDDDHNGGNGDDDHNGGNGDDHNGGNNDDNKDNSNSRNDHDIELLIMLQYTNALLQESEFITIININEFIQPYHHHHHHHHDNDNDNINIKNILSRFDPTLSQIMILYNSSSSSSVDGSDGYKSIVKTSDIISIRRNRCICMNREIYVHDWIIST